MNVLLRNDNIHTARGSKNKSQEMSKENFGFILIQLDSFCRCLEGLPALCRGLGTLSLKEVSVVG